MKATREAANRVVHQLLQRWGQVPIAALAFFMLGSGNLAAQGTETACLAKKTLEQRLEFATRDRGRIVLRRPGEWARQLSAFERSARMRTLDPRSVQDFLGFAGEAALTWTADEIELWSGLAEVLSDALVGLNPKMPQAVDRNFNPGIRQFRQVATDLKAC